MQDLWRVTESIQEAVPVQPLKQIHLRVETKLAALDQVLAWFMQVRVPGVPERFWLSCQIALAEAFTNVVRHAHAGYSSEIPIELEVLIFPTYLEIRIWDYGPVFNLEAAMEALPERMDKPREHGWGLKLIRDIVDQYHYTRLDNGRNFLCLVKYLPQDSTLGG